MPVRIFATSPLERDQHRARADSESVTSQERFKIVAFAGDTKNNLFVECVIKIFCEIKTTKSPLSQLFKKRLLFKLNTGILELNKISMCLQKSLVPYLMVFSLKIKATCYIVLIVKLKKLKKLMKFFSSRLLSKSY